MKIKLLWILPSLLGAALLTNCSPMDCESHLVTNLDATWEKPFCTDQSLPSLTFEYGKEHLPPGEMEVVATGKLPDDPNSVFSMTIYSDEIGVSVNFGVTLKEPGTQKTLTYYNKVLKRSKTGNDTWYGEVSFSKDSESNHKVAEQNLQAGTDTEMLNIAEQLLHHFEGHSAPFPTLDPKLAAQLREYLTQSLPKNLL